MARAGEGDEGTDGLADGGLDCRPRVAFADEDEPNARGKERGHRPDEERIVLLLDEAADGSDDDRVLGDPVSSRTAARAAGFLVKPPSGIPFSITESAPRRGRSFRAATSAVSLATATK